MRILLFILFIISYPIHASIYKCKVDDVLSFSQFPCSKDAVEIIVKTSATSYEAGFRKNTIYSRTVIDALVQLKQVIIDLKENKLKKRLLQKQLKNKISQLNNRANKNLGEFNHQELEDNKSEITSQFTKQIKMTQDTIDSLVHSKSSILYKINSQDNILEFEQHFSSNAQSHVQQIENILQSHEIHSKIKQQQDNLRLFQLNLNNELAHAKRQSQLSNDPASFEIKSTNIKNKYNEKIRFANNKISDLLKEEKLLYKSN
ncbi:hypothetical protein [Pseudoalteromonas denitrificans]|uniref:DUF4124 domain-containing protein n=1 Tax=Pseudoalteromonas denitrificans DSM 6059 TaxID=1123010 RepID=A0A1I1P073_9GAMM|nr:hypothetical protein [Pseudoalteromonas denitrificans]SFD00373.1 hypothetical protein SAMN02745724_03160 [Pseudoalteromonas denitrificans DSM 6059]